MKLTGLAFLIAVVSMFACSSSSSSVTSSALASTACSWPSLDGADGGRDTCSPARALISCTNSDGSGEGCTSSGAIGCHGSDDSNCKDECNANEYVASCGGVGPGPVPDPPSGCRSMGGIPAGIAQYCCPCGT